MKSQIPGKVVKTLILFGFVYQLYDLTRDYLRYNYLIEVNIRDAVSIVPSITICIRSWDQMSPHLFHRPKNIVNKTIYCTFYREGDLNKKLSCDQIDGQIWMRYKKNSICLTFLNRADLMGNINMYGMSIRAYLFRRAEYFIHPAYSHSHFERTNHFNFELTPIIKTKIKTTVGGRLEIKKWEQTLLPYPYSTNCFDYSINRRNNIRPKSQTDCKFEYMRRKELHECKHNYYWSQHLFDDNQHILDFNRTFPNCSVKVNQRFLDKVCQKDCQTTQFFADLRKEIYNFAGCYINYYENKDKYIHSTYLAKMDLIAYFSTLGGLISIYFGFGVSDLFEILIETCSIFFITFFKWFKKYFNHSKHSRNKQRVRKCIFINILLHNVIPII